MGNLRSAQVSNSQAADSQATTNASNAAAANSVPALRIVVADNSGTIQELILSNQRLEALVNRLIRKTKGV